MCRRRPCPAPGARVRREAPRSAAATWARDTTLNAGLAETAERSFSCVFRAFCVDRRGGSLQPFAPCGGLYFLPSLKAGPTARPEDLWVPWPPRKPALHYVAERPPPHDLGRNQLLTARGAVEDLVF